MARRVVRRAAAVAGIVTTAVVAAAEGGGAVEVAGCAALVTEPDSAWGAVPVGLELGPLPLSRRTMKPSPMAKITMTRPPTAMSTRRSRS